MLFQAQSLAGVTEGQCHLLPLCGSQTGRWVLACLWVRVCSGWQCKPQLHGLSLSRLPGLCLSSPLWLHPPALGMHPVLGARAGVPGTGWSRGSWWCP